MSPKLPRITAADAIRAVTRSGFVKVRQSGSHQIYKNDEGTRITIPVHAGKTLHPKIIKSIIRDLDISIEEFRKLI